MAIKFTSEIFLLCRIFNGFCLKSSLHSTYSDTLEICSKKKLAVTDSFKKLSKIKKVTTLMLAEQKFEDKISIVILLKTSNKLYQTQKSSGVCKFFPYIHQHCTTSHQKQQEPS